jgi:hypothetical protein
MAGRPTTPVGYRGRCRGSWPTTAGGTSEGGGTAISRPFAGVVQQPPDGGDAQQGTARRPTRRASTTAMVALQEPQVRYCPSPAAQSSILRPFRPRPPCRGWTRRSRGHCPTLGHQPGGVRSRGFPCFRVAQFQLVTSAQFKFVTYIPGRWGLSPAPVSRETPE